MAARTEAPTVLVFWRGQRTADAIGEAIAGHAAKDSTPSHSDGASYAGRGPLELQAGVHGC